MNGNCNKLNKRAEFASAGRICPPVNQHRTAFEVAPCLHFFGVAVAEEIVGVPRETRGSWVSSEPQPITGNRQSGISRPREARDGWGRGRFAGRAPLRC